MQILDTPGCQGERAQLGEVSTCQTHGDRISLSMFPPFYKTRDQLRTPRRGFHFMLRNEPFEQYLRDYPEEIPKVLRRYSPQ